MKYKSLKFIGVLCIFAFARSVDARETLIQLPNGALDKIITDFKGTRVYNNGNLVYSSDGDSHEQTMNKILKSGGSLVSDNKSFSFSVSGRVPAIGPGPAGTASTSSSAATSELSGISSSTSTSGAASSSSKPASDFTASDSLSVPDSSSASDSSSPSSTLPVKGLDLVPSFTPDREE